jgi:hypothetical protein
VSQRCDTREHDRDADQYARCAGRPDVGPEDEDQDRDDELAAGRATMQAYMVNCLFQ